MKKITVVVDGGWKYTGHQSTEKMSPLGRLEWIQIIQNGKKVKIHAKYIMSITEHKTCLR